MNNKEIRALFPMANQVVYLDSAALVLKPQTAIDAMVDFYTNKSISSRTSDTKIGYLVNQKINQVRQKVADLLDADSSEIIFTSGTTESINNFAYMFSQTLTQGDIVLLSAYNHSSNMIVWIELSKKYGFTVEIVENLYENIRKGVKLVSLSQETNNFNANFNIEKIAQKAHEVGAFVFNDAAQAISHDKVSLKVVDGIAFSSNKFYGPTGIGVLAIKKEFLIKLKPAKFGGGTVVDVPKDHNNWTMRNTISAFEPGTPDLAGFFMFDAALDFFNSIGYQKTQAILDELANYLYDRLTEVEGLKIHTKRGDYITLVTFEKYGTQDVATYLGSKDIYTISGIFCAPYLRNIYENHSYLRISLGIYNNYEDIDKLIEALEQGDYYEAIF
ncbi:aminotransferase class V-fold PLP-dependent enzyme [Mycoplasma corogypsi]|uniref:aminotransferase class V-fold PLP-dependent enzyme n=1 Tax=Mycoplasma corogypsi TaxID=2106 RepID=UPI0038736BFF